MKAFIAPILAATLGASVLCPLCDSALAGQRPSAPLSAAQVADTATVRLHISGMTCGTCPATARMALSKVSGVYSATVTLDDSLGVVRFDPRRVQPREIASQLTKMTGYGARILADSSKATHKRGTQ